MLAFLLSMVVVNFLALTVFDATPMTEHDRRVAYTALLVGNIGTVVALQRFVEVLR